MDVFRSGPYSGGMRGRGFRFALGGVLALGLGLGPAGGWAQDGADTAPSAQGMVVAFACGTVAPGAAFDVEALDDTPAQTKLRDTIAADLARRGYRVASGAPLTLTFEGGISRTRVEQGRHTVGSLNSNNDVTEFRLNMWSSEKDSVFGGLKDFIPGNDPNLYRLAIFVHDRADGKCMWQGEARHAVVGNNAAATARKLVPVVLRRLGKTAKVTPFTLPE